MFFSRLFICFLELGVKVVLRVDVASFAELAVVKSATWVREMFSRISAIVVASSYKYSSRR